MSHKRGFDCITLKWVSVEICLDICWSFFTALFADGFQTEYNIIRDGKSTCELTLVGDHFSRTVDRRSFMKMPFEFID